MPPDSNSRYHRAAFEQSPIGIVVYGRDLRVIECNVSFAELMHSTREHIIGLAIDDLRDQRHRSAVVQALDGETVTYEFPFQATTTDTWPWMQATFGPLRDASGAVEAALVMARQRRAHANAATDAASTRSVQLQLGDTQRLGQIGSWTWDADRSVAAASPELYRILDVSSQWVAASPKDYLSVIHPDDRAECRDLFANVLEQRLALPSREFRIVRPDESIRWIALRAEFHFADDGHLLGAWGLIQDVTERRLLEEELRQAHKMEAVGQLAAGIAHDFNNLLTVIEVESDELDIGLEVGHPMHETVRRIRTAAERGAGLTRQLLAFSRRQILRPRMLDLNDTVAGAVQMLGRLIGKDIELVTNLASHLPFILADPGQLVQALVNLVVNARDAMPDGGKLSIATCVEVVGDERRDRLPDGEYVAIVVTDTGHGMDEATLQLIFEPFFTTKALGRGTGLGLSTVHSIMEQAAGHITVASEPGKGTTFTLYFLPQARIELVATSSASAAQSTLPVAGVVLVVEDEPAIRTLCRRILEREGHEVLVAEDGAAALAAAAAHSGRIGLLLTDVVLPKLNGREVYDRLKVEHPGLRVLYMSGYTDEIVRSGMISTDARMIEKPFATADLVAAVRDALDA